MMKTIKILGAITFPVIMLLFPMISKGQNISHDFNIVDTAGNNYLVSLRLKNIELKSISKISVFKRDTPDSSDIHLKELNIFPMGQSFLVVDEHEQYIVRNAINTHIKVAKKHFENSTFSFRISYSDGHSKYFFINKK